MFDYIGLARLFLLLMGIVMQLSLPGLDQVTEVKENGFSEGVNKASVHQGIMYDYKKVTQEVLTSQKSGNIELVADTIINALLRETHCIECGNSDDIDIIKSQYSLSSKDGNLHYVGYEYIAAFIPSKRGDSSEVIIISVSFPWVNNGKGELGGVAGLVIPLSKHFEKAFWTSKDIILLFTDSNVPNSMGITSFLNDLTTNQKLLKYNGRIRTVLCVEMLSLTPKKILIDIESMDGLQPNQDFPNAVIREIESYFLYPPIYITTKTFWESITRHAFNRGSGRPHSRFLQNNIPSFTLSFVDETPELNNESPHSLKQINKKEFISTSPIPIFEIFKILEGVTKIQSNLHDEFYQSTKKYYYTSYYSVLNFGFCLIPLIPMLISPLLEILLYISAAENSLVLIGIIIAALLLSTSIPILFLTRYFIEQIGYFSFRCSYFPVAENMNLKGLFAILSLSILFSTALVAFCAKMLIKIFQIQKDNNIYKSITISFQAMINILIIVFSIFISIKNFGTSIFVIPIILLINLMMSNSTIRRFSIGIVITTTLLHFYFKERLRSWGCSLATIMIRKVRYFLLWLGNFLYSKNLTNNFGFNPVKARSFASIWDSALGGDIFCHSEYKSPNGLANICNTQFDNTAQITKQYKIIKTVPILQWISWLEIKLEQNICNYNGGNSYDILTETLLHLFKDDGCLKSTILKDMLIGLLAPLILALSLTLL